MTKKIQYQPCAICVNDIKLAEEGYPPRPVHVSRQKFDTPEEAINHLKSFFSPEVVVEIFALATNEKIVGNVVAYSIVKK